MKTVIGAAFCFVLGVFAMVGYMTLNPHKAAELGSLTAGKAKEIASKVSDEKEDLVYNRCKQQFFARTSCLQKRSQEKCEAELNAECGTK